jgi:raffinose/stachyose/melibiose transport system permease protein
VTTLSGDKSTPRDSLLRRLTFTRRRGGPRRVPWVLAVPAVAFLVAFHFIPAVAGGWYAFTDWNGVSASADWVGLRNFRQIFDSSDTRGALFHTLELAGSFVVLVNVMGLALALGLNRGVKSRNVLRSLFFAPVIVSPLAVAYIFQYVFDYGGPLNKFLGWVGLDSWQRPWLGDPHWALWTILVVLVWQFSGLTMVIYLAGLQGIPQELDEATAVDGATLWMRFRRVTLPLLAPAITVNVTLTLIFGLRVFDQVLGLTGGGPVDATETLATQVYKQTFAYGRFGYGAALALMLAGLISIMAISQALILRARETH